MRSIALLAVMFLMGCGAPTPPPRNYVLSTPVEPVAGVVKEDGRPVVELRTLSVPDYLDTTDILQRDGRNELKASTTGRWGERLSVGMAHALVVSLSRRMPSLLITRSAISGQPARELRVDVEAFDVWPDGRCGLTARWTILRDDRTVETAERGTFVAQARADASGISDAATVSAMTDAVEQLAARIAADLGRPADRRK